MLVLFYNINCPVNYVLRGEGIYLMTPSFPSLSTVCYPNGEAEVTNPITPSLSYLELLALPDPDLNLGVGVAEAGPAEERHLLHLRQRVGVLGVDLLVVHSLCGRGFHRISNGSRGAVYIMSESRVHVGRVISFLEVATDLNYLPGQLGT